MRSNVTKKIFSIVLSCAVAISFSTLGATSTYAAKSTAKKTTSKKTTNKKTTSKKNTSKNAKSQKSSKKVSVPTIKSLTAKGQTFTVKYSKVSGVSGYQVRYSTYSNLKKATYKKTKALSLKVSKLKANKTYYVQVRTFKKSGKKYFYGKKWSAKKSVKTKKTATVSKVGAWKINTSYPQAKLPKDAQDALNEAKTGYVGVSIKPIALLTTQIVSGINYNFLCLVAPVTPKATSSLKIVTVYKSSDAKEKAKFTKFTAFDIAKYATKKGNVSYKTLDGGITPYTDTPKVTLPNEVNKAFNEATKSLVGVTYEPIAYLGKQVVSGSNYSILCIGTPSTKDAVKHIYVMTVYKGINKTATVKNICGLY